MLDSDPVRPAKGSRHEPVPSKLREERIRKGLTREVLAALAGVHPNSIKNLENGATKEVFSETAAALATALDTTVADLGLKVRPAVAPSIRLRELSAERRALLQEILSLPEEQYALLRAALQRIRGKRKS